jgi:hypothetical protein
LRHGVAEIFQPARPEKLNLTGQKIRLDPPVADCPAYRGACHTQTPGKLVARQKLNSHHVGERVNAAGIFPWSKLHAGLHGIFKWKP